MTLLSDIIDRQVENLINRERVKNPNFDLQAGFRRLIDSMNWHNWDSTHR